MGACRGTAHALLHERRERLGLEPVEFRVHLGQESNLGGFDIAREAFLKRARGAVRCRRPDAAHGGLTRNSSTCSLRSNASSRMRRTQRSWRATRSFCGEPGGAPVGGSGASDEAARCANQSADELGILGPRLSIQGDHSAHKIFVLSDQILLPLGLVRDGRRGVRLRRPRWWASPGVLRLSKRTLRPNSRTAASLRPPLPWSVRVRSFILARR